MKTSCLFVLMIGWLIYSPMGHSQSASPAFYPRQYVVEVRFASHARVQEGILYDLTDSTILLAPKNWSKSRMKTMINQHGGTLPLTDSLQQTLPLRTYRYADIRRLTLYRRGQVGLGLLIGAGLGAAIGFSLGDDRSTGFFSLTAGSKAFLGAIGLALPGVVTGAAMSKRINAKNQSVEIEVKKRFREYTIVEQVNRANLYSPYR